MQSDQLADILFQQDIQGKTAQELRAQGKDELANRLEQKTAADEFNATIAKLKDLLVDVFAALEPILGSIYRYFECSYFYFITFNRFNWMGKFIWSNYGNYCFTINSCWYCCFIP